MSWQVRHQGSPEALSGLTWEQLVAGLRDGLWLPDDEVKGPTDKDWILIEDHPQLAEILAEEEPPQAHVEEVHLDMNALIDVTLVLLIFFILTTAHASVLQKVVPLPSLTSDPGSGVRRVSTAQAKKYMIHLRVRGKGAGENPQVILEGQPIEVWTADQRLNSSRLIALLRPYVRGDPPRVELLLDAQQVSWGLVVQLQDAARAAGIRVVHHVHHPPSSQK